MTRLSVNINKVATLRNARGENVPDVLKFAVYCEKCGAQGITVHPRPDERHITRADVYALKPLVATEFNIEGYPDERFMEIVSDVRPAQATLVPDAPGVLTSSAGWDVEHNKEFLRDIVSRLKALGIRVSIFVAPDESAIRGAAEVGADRIELYTKPYADGYEEDREAAVAPFVKGAELAHSLGLGVNAGHDLSARNLSYFHTMVPWLDEVSIGQAIIADALYEGIGKTIRTYLDCLLPKH